MDGKEQQNIPAKTIVIRKLTEEGYRATASEVAKNTEKQKQRFLRRQKIIESGKGTYISTKGAIIQYEHGIKIVLPLENQFIPTTIGRRKRNPISDFSKSTRKRLRKALLCTDLPNGSQRFGVTITLPWDDSDWDDYLLNDFHSTVETFRTAFARCFPLCAIIYRLERQERGAPHMHSVFYAPLDNGWIVNAYDHVSRMRNSQNTNTPIGELPTTFDLNIKSKFLCNVFSALWFNAISHRLFRTKQLQSYWEKCIRVQAIESDPKMFQYMLKTEQSLKNVKAWGYMQRKNLTERRSEPISYNPEGVPLEGRILVLMARCISQWSRKQLSYGNHSLAPFGWHYSRWKRRHGFFLGVTPNLTKRIIDWAYKEVKGREMDYVIPYRPTPRQTLTNPILNRYVNIPQTQTHQ